MGSREKLSIYPNPQPEIVLIEAPHPLAAHIKVAREHTTDALSGVRAQVESVVDKWVGFERRVEREVKSVLPKDEPLTPGILYIGVAGLAGSVIARNRNIVARLILPPALFLAASPYFLPKTSHNVRQYLARIEDAHFPELARQHDELVRSASSTFRSAVNRAEGLGVDVKSISGKVVRQVEDTTGLRLGEVLGRAQEIEQNVAREIERERHVRETSVEGGKGEVIGVVMEATPVAQIVVPPASTEPEVAPAQAESNLVLVETEPAVAPVDTEPAVAPAAQIEEVKAVPVATDEKIVEKTEVESEEKPAARLV